MNEGPTARHSRFETPSARLDLGAVGARQMRKVRIVSLAAAIALHGSLAVWKVSMERKAVKPLTTRFIKREPRLVKPLELRKAPRPKRREMRRRMKQVRAKVDTRGIGRAPKASRVLEGMARPATTVSQAASFERPMLEPTIESGTVVTAKTGGRRMDLSLEMVDISALDTGRDRAFIIQNPEDKREVRGFFHIARTYVHSASFLDPAHGYVVSASIYMPELGRNARPMAIPHLAEAVNEYTDIHVDVLDDVALDDAKLLEVPWVVFMPTVEFDPSQTELRNLGQYLASGGFLFAEGMLEFSDALIEKALETQGMRRARHWNRVVVPNDHPVYHAFFDFDGPPGGNDPGAATKAVYGSVARGGAGALRGTRGTLFPVNWLVRHDGHVMGILEAKGYVRFWTRYSHDDGWNFRPADFRDALQFGVNTIVFALTQEGSLAQRVVAATR